MRQFLPVIVLSLQIGYLHSYPKADPRPNGPFLKQGSHNLLKVEHSNSSVPRKARCKPCETDKGDHVKPLPNNLTPDYRGNGADNLGYDWSPKAWGGPAFPQKIKLYIHENRARDGRNMGTTMNQDNQGNLRVVCDTCRTYWEKTGSGGEDVNDERKKGPLVYDIGNDGGNGNDRPGYWQENKQTTPSDYQARVSSPALGVSVRPGSRIVYIPTRSGEMYWDGVSGGGTRWDGFSNGISWVTNPVDWDGMDSSVREDKPNLTPSPQYGFQRPGSEAYPRDFPTWDPQRGNPPWDWGRGYNFANGYPNFNRVDPRDRGYASNWHYGSTDQNGWNGNNMKWNYGGKQWDDNDKAANRFYPNIPQNRAYGPIRGQGGGPGEAPGGNNLQYGNQYPKTWRPQQQGGYRVIERDNTGTQADADRPWDYNSNRGTTRPEWTRPGPIFIVPGDNRRPPYGPGNSPNDKGSNGGNGYGYGSSASGQSGGGYPYGGNRYPGDGSGNGVNHMFYPNDGTPKPVYSSDFRPTYPAGSGRPSGGIIKILTIERPTGGSGYPNGGTFHPLHGNSGEGNPSGNYPGGGSPSDGYPSGGSSSGGYPGGGYFGTGYLGSEYPIGGYSWGSYPGGGNRPGGSPTGNGSPTGYPKAVILYPVGGSRPGPYPGGGGRPDGYPGGYPNGGRPDGYPGGYPNGGRPDGYPGGYPNGGRPDGYPGGYPNAGRPDGYPGGYSNGGRPDGYPGGYPNAGRPDGYPGGYSNTGRPDAYPGGYSNGGRPDAYPGGYPNGGRPDGYPGGYPNGGRPDGYPAGGAPYPNRPGGIGFPYPILNGPYEGGPGGRPGGYIKVGSRPGDFITGPGGYQNGESGLGGYPNGLGGNYSGEGAPVGETKPSYVGGMGKNSIRGYYTGTITELDPNIGQGHYGSGSGGGQGGQSFGGSYPGNKNTYPRKDKYPYGENSNRYPTDAKDRYHSYGQDRYFGGGPGAHGGHSGNVGHGGGSNGYLQGGNKYGGDRFYYGQNMNSDKYTGGGYPSNHRYPDGEGGSGGGNKAHVSGGHGGNGLGGSDHNSSSHGGSGGSDFDRIPSSNENKNSWNYGQDERKDGIYRRSGGSYPPYKGGQYFTSSYLAPMATTSGSSLKGSETKTQSVTQLDEATEPTLS